MIFIYFLILKENVDVNANIQMQHNCHLMNDLQIESDEF